jgi:hypothetical protein
MADPSETLIRWFRSYDGVTDEDLKVALTEVERRAPIDARLSAWLRASDGGSVLITKGGVSLCWADANFTPREVNVADNALDPLDLGQRATLIERALDEAEKPHA